MRLTKLDFIGRIGDAAFTKLLELSASSVDVMKLVKLVDWATPDPDGTSIDLDDARVQKVREMEPMLVSLGVVTAGWADSVLYIPAPVVPASPAAFVATHMVQDFGQAMVDADGTVRLADGRWTTLDALATMGKTVEAL